MKKSDVNEIVRIGEETLPDGTVILHYPNGGKFICKGKLDPNDKDDQRRVSDWYKFSYELMRRRAQEKLVI